MLMIKELFYVNDERAFTCKSICIFMIKKETCMAMLQECVLMIKENLHIEKHVFVTGNGVCGCYIYICLLLRTVAIALLENKKLHNGIMGKQW